MLIRLTGNEVAYAYGYLANAYGLSGNEPITRPLDPDQKVKLLDALNHVETVCSQSRLDLPTTLAHIPRVRAAVKTASKYGDIQVFIGELRTRMHDELKARLFLFVPPIEARFYNQKQAFGADVETQFPMIAGDIEQAGDGIAVGMPTAAVFHLMRIMEILVQQLGAHLGVKNSAELNWQKILDQANAKIKELPETTAAEKTHKEILAAVSANLFNVKLAWRNPTMHPKSSYTAEEAVEIWDCVKRFATHLTTAI